MNTYPSIILYTFNFRVYHNGQKYISEKGNKREVKATIFKKSNKIEF